MVVSLVIVVDIVIDKFSIRLIGFVIYGCNNAQSAACERALRVYVRVCECANVCVCVCACTRLRAILRLCYMRANTVLVRFGVCVSVCVCGRARGPSERASDETRKRVLLRYGSVCAHLRAARTASERPAQLARS